MTLRKLLEVQSPSVRKKREPVTKLISEVRGSTHYSLASQLSKIVRHEIAIPSELNIVDGDDYSLQLQAPRTQLFWM